MADEALQTDAPNSETSTEGSEQTAVVSSTTTQNDPLDGTSLLGDAPSADPSQPGDDVKPAESDGAGETGKDEPPSLTGAPEGDYELTLPEGVSVDTEALAAFAPIAKELNLSNAGASKVAEFYASNILPQATKAATDALMGNVVEQRAAWDKATREMIAGGKAEDGTPIPADPDFGGKTLDQVRVVTAKALDRFGGAEYRAFLNETGLGNDPRMMKAWFKIGEAISEDTEFHRSGGVPNTPKTREEKYYGSAQ